MNTTTVSTNRNGTMVPISKPWRLNIDDKVSIKKSPRNGPAPPVHQFRLNTGESVAGDGAESVTDAGQDQPPTNPDAGLSALPNSAAITYSAPMTYRVKAAATSPSTRS